MTIAQWLNALIPMPQIVGIVNQVLIAFVLVAVMILVICAISQVDRALCVYC